MAARPGLIERATRLPGGSDPAPEFIDLPTLAEVYVRGPLEVLTGGDAARALPEQIVGSLRARWRSACAAYRPAAAFGSAAAELLGRSPPAARLLAATDTPPPLGRPAASRDGYPATPQPPRRHPSAARLLAAITTRHLAAPRPDVYRIFIEVNPA